MPNPTPHLDWPAPDSHDFIDTLCVFAEHLSAEEIERGMLLRISAHGRGLLEHFERAILGERIAEPARRAILVAAIGWAGQERSTTAIRAALDDPSPQVRRAAARAAWQNLRQTRLVPRLLELLRRPGDELDVAVAAADSLSRFRVAEAMPPMVALALRQNAGPSEDEAESLLASIERLAGVRFAPEDQPLTLRQRLVRLRNWWQAVEEQQP